MVIVRLLGMLFLIVICCYIVSGGLDPQRDRPDEHEKDEKWRNGWRDYP